MSRRHEITLTQLRYFATAAERRSMTEAARELFVAQSAVSAAIGQLEQQVGTQLFIRQRSKGLVLTPAGVQLLGDVRALMLGLDQAVDAARGMDNQVRGTIRRAPGGRRGRGAHPEHHRPAPAPAPASST